MRLPLCKTDRSRRLGTPAPDFRDGAFRQNVEANMRTQRNVETREARKERLKQQAEVKAEASAAAEAAADRMIRENIRLFGP